MNYRLFGILGIVLVVYGYLCRGIGIYFFWESKQIGWAVLFFSIILFLFNRMKKKEKGRSRGLEIIGIFIFAFILLVQAILFLVLVNHSATKIAQEYVQSNPLIKDDIGALKGFSIIPQGSISTSSDSSGAQGEAEIQMIVKGAKKYLEVTVLLVKEKTSEWRVIDIKK